MFEHQPEFIGYLPHLQAALNVLSTLFILLGVGRIRRNNRSGHIMAMILALITSSIFLASYLVYHAYVGHVEFAGVGEVRAIYFTILISHVLFAAIALVMIIMTVLRAWKGIRLERSGGDGSTQLEAHRRIAYKTAFIWLYVSVTGVVVYWMAFHIYTSS
ncbi:MAG: DUF420 domain-containing protein [Magnetococcales bacterium]|nr:DUF420 domain-containing protein [Magnetococcales bacterium]